MSYAVLPTYHYQEVYKALIHNKILAELKAKPVPSKDLVLLFATPYFQTFRQP